jgi:hypothetical protein
MTQKLIERERERKEMEKNRKRSLKMGEKLIERERQKWKEQKQREKKKHNGIVRCSSKITVKMVSIFRMKGNINHKAV